MAFHPALVPEYYFVCPKREPTRHQYELNLEDLITPLALAANLLNHQQLRQKNETATTAGTQISNATKKSDEDKFKVSLDVQQFRPEEISVKIVDKNIIAVEAKHEEKRDDHGFISRHFVRKYVIPDGYDITKVESRLSSDGVLSILAPKIKSSQVEYREIPVIRTGEPTPVKGKESETSKEETKP